MSIFHVSLAREHATWHDGRTMAMGNEGTSRRGRRALAAGLAMAVAAGATGAMAQPPAPAPPAGSSGASDGVIMVDSPAERAAKLKAEGLKAMAAKDFRRAYELLGEALNNQKSFDLADAYGSAALELNKFREAAEYLAWSVAHAPPDQNMDPTRKKLAAAKTECATVRLGANVTGADLFVDGTKVGAAPLENERYLEPGPHVFEATHPDYVAARSDRTVPKSVDSVVDLVLKRKAAGRTDPPGPDGPADTTGPCWWPAIAFFSAGAVSLGIGGALVGVATSKKNTARDLSDGIAADGGGCRPAADGFATRCDELESILSSADRMTWGYRGAFLAGGVLVGGGIIAVIVAKTRKPPATMSSLRPRWGLGGIGLDGTF